MAGWRVGLDERTEKVWISLREEIVITRTEYLVLMWLLFKPLEKVDVLGDAVVAREVTRVQEKVSRWKG